MSLNQLFDQFLGSQQTNTNAAQNNNAQGGGGISDLASNIPGGLVGGLAAGGLLGVLMGNKKARKTVGKVAGGAVGLGGAAVLGAVAFNAYKNWQSGKNAPMGPAPTASANSAPSSVPQVPYTPAASVPSAPANSEDFDPIKTMAADGNPFQLALVKAMIAAANADGHIDAKEQAAIFDTVNKLELEASDKAVIFDTLQNPPEIGEIAGLAKGLEQASEIYLVSRMAINPDRPSETAYLNDLAVMMSLPQELVAHLEHQISQQQG